MPILDSKTCLVTGGAGHFAATARLFLGEGAGVLHLASNQSSFRTGSMLVVDGGMG